MATHSTSIAVKHNIEVAHRLFELPGKCENIHGHSMQVTMQLFGPINDKGILGGIEYGDLKHLFRSHLDETYDHRVLLNVEDPWSRPLFLMERDEDSGQFVEASRQVFLPGLNSVPGDPTTENIAAWIAHDMEAKLFNPDLPWGKDLYTMKVTVWETAVNMAEVSIGLERS
jgi:6-pyruvoyltetrahydropterin/6-carboxytetrahydropterin synthase